MSVGVHFGRLRKLLDHMEGGQLSVGRFDFNCWRDGCGTAGCMGGELPMVFPGEWVWKGGMPWLKPFDEEDRCPVHFTSQAAWFFGIQFGDVVDLFFPAGSGEELAGRLRANATRQQVAEKLRLFIERKEATYRRWSISEEAEGWRRFDK